MLGKVIKFIEEYNLIKRIANIFAYLTIIYDFIFDLFDGGISSGIL